MADGRREAAADFHERNGSSYADYIRKWNCMKDNWWLSAYENAYPEDMWVQAIRDRRSADEVPVFSCSGPFASAFSAAAARNPGRALRPLSLSRSRMLHSMCTLHP